MMPSKQSTRLAWRPTNYNGRVLSAVMMGAQFRREVRARVKTSGKGPIADRDQASEGDNAQKYEGYNRRDPLDRHLVPN